MEESTPVQQLYRNVPLNSDRREIRLLSIKDAKSDDTIRCSIWSTSVDSAPDFIALSYAWGEDIKSETVCIEGINVPVTRSVLGALSGIRAHDAASSSMKSPIRRSDGSIRPIWIDAVCINQEDNDEKAKQVLLMLSIYSKASNVIVWMGHGNAQTDAAFELMCNRASNINSKPPRDVSAPTFQPTETLFSSSEESRTFLQGRDTFPPTPEWMMLERVMKEDICKRTWWSRLWVRQEFVLAHQSPFMMCGDRGIPWDWFIFYFIHLARIWSHPENATATAAQRHGITAEVTASYGIHPISLHYLRENFKRVGSLSLEKVFRYLVRNALASDPHDYIYGLLGLVSDKLQSRITPDYSRECMELYREVGTLLWREEPRIMLTELIHLYHFHGEENGYPSWIPDFRQTKLRAWQDRKALQAAGVWRKLKVPCFDEARACLVLKGLYVDRIDATYRTPKTLPGNDELAELVKRYERILSEAQNRQASPEHRSATLTVAKKVETPMRILTRSSVAQLDGDERFHPRHSDEDVWDAFLGRKLIENLRHDKQQSAEGLFLRLRRMLTAKIEDRCIFTTRTGFCGVGIMGIEVGDVVAVMFGASGPIIFRSFEGFYRLVGCAYVSGLMDSKVLDGVVNRNELNVQRFEIR